MYLSSLFPEEVHRGSRPLWVGEDWGMGELSPAGRCLRNGADGLSWHLKGRIIRLAGSSNPGPWFWEGIAFSQPERQ